MEKQLTIKETIDKITDELARADDILSKILNSPETDDYACRKCEVLTELKDDITRTLQDELSYFKERIEFAMLIATTVNDIAILTMYDILNNVEPKYPLPIDENGLIDTETIYNAIEDIAKEVKRSE